MELNHVVLFQNGEQWKMKGKQQITLHFCCSDMDFALAEAWWLWVSWLFVLFHDHTISCDDLICLSCAPWPVFLCDDRIILCHFMSLLPETHSRCDTGLTHLSHNAWNQIKGCISAASTLTETLLNGKMSTPQSYGGPLNKEMQTLLYTKVLHNFFVHLIHRTEKSIAHKYDADTAKFPNNFHIKHQHMKTSPDTMPHQLSLNFLTQSLSRLMTFHLPNLLTPPYSM